MNAHTINATTQSDVALLIVCSTIAACVITAFLAFRLGYRKRAPAAHRYWHCLGMGSAAAGIVLTLWHWLGPSAQTQGADVLPYLAGGLILFGFVLALSHFKKPRTHRSAWNEGRAKMKNRSGGGPDATGLGDGGF